MCVGHTEIPRMRLHRELLMNYRKKNKAQNCRYATCISQMEPTSEANVASDPMFLVLLSLLLEFWVPSNTVSVVSELRP